MADTACHVREFAKIMDRLDGTRQLPGWIETAAISATTSTPSSKG